MALPGRGKSGAAARGQAALIVVILTSIASSVSLIMVNKHLMQHYHFKFVLSLTTFHFICTWGALEVVSRFGVFEPAHLLSAERLKVAGAGVGSIVFMNLSLKTNSVGTYQAMKLLCVPAVMMINWLVRRVDDTSKRAKLALAILLVGVGLATVTDVAFTTLGTFVGGIAVLTTAQFQIWQGSKQREFGLTSVQLTHTLAPYQAAVTGALALVVDIFGVFGGSSVLDHAISGWEIVFIVLSGAIAVSVNLCSMGLIGKTSAITYQVVGHSKTVLVFLGGFLFFNQIVDATNLLGISIAMAGVACYSYVKLHGL